MHKVLITGASSGLGAGLAREYAASGVSLGLVARRKELLEELAKELRAQGAQVSTYVADVRETEEMNRVVRDFAQLTGGLDVCIANAGIGEGRKGERFDPEKVARVFEVNLKGLTNTLLPAVEIMEAQGSGTLVGMASVAGYRALPGSLAYSASKSGVIAFMEGLEMELSGSGVHAMSLCPGFVRTPLTDKNDFKMPFRLECDEACRRMRQAIEAKKSRYTFPFPMWVAAQALRVAPQWVLQLASPKGKRRKTAP